MHVRWFSTKVRLAFWSIVALLSERVVDVHGCRWVDKRPSLGALSTLRRRDEMTDAERRRLEEARDPRAGWRRWGPYLSERQWGTVREDYSATGDAWNYLSHDQARSRAYRWGEDGLAGLCDDQQRLCFALALWNRARSSRSVRSVSRTPRATTART